MSSDVGSSGGKGDSSVKRRDVDWILELFKHSSEQYELPRELTSSDSRIADESES